jgi:hypothetical protein
MPGNLHFAFFMDCAVPWETVLQQLAATPLVRGLVEARFRSQARRRLAELDHESVERAQYRLLAGLVHQARSTRFGRDHDFRRIRTPDDYRRLVPVRTLAELGQEYWPANTNLDHTTWPQLPFAAPFPRGHGPLPWLPLSRELLAAHGAAALTALGLVSKARPHTPLFAGRILVLGKGAPVRIGSRTTTGSVEALAFAQLPPWLRPFIQGPLDLNRLEEAEAQRWMDDLLSAPLICVAGTTKRLLQFFTRAREISGRPRAVDVWPELAAVLFSRGYAHGSRQPLEEAVGGPGVVFLEFCFRPEGALAVEDPRSGLLRLLPDHGIFMEFIPVEELGHPNPTRHGLAEVEIGVPYALALTSAGIWACLGDVRVCFASREPPLLRLMELPASKEMGIEDRGSRIEDRRSTGAGREATEKELLSCSLNPQSSILNPQSSILCPGGLVR